MSRRRYVTAWEPDGEWVYSEVERPSLTVFDQERSPQRTGLLDKYGNELLAVTDPNPIGFLAEIEDE